MSVSELTDALKRSLEAGFTEVQVRGEVTNLTRAASGHCYFTLKGDGAQLKTVMYRGFAFRLNFDLENGQEVVAKGGVTVYPPRGEYQLIAQSLAPVGLGGAELAFQRLKNRLAELGYFRAARKRPLKKFPVRLALIASPTGAAVRDMLELLAQRWPAAEVVVRPSRVQGAGAEDELACAIAQLNHCHRSHRLTFCALVLGRGGGSAEDLAAFNTEAVARAVYQSAVPVVSAVGHEVDVSLADLVADYRALTPSQAILALTPDRREVLADLTTQQSRLDDAMRARLDLARERLNRIAERPAFVRPLDRLRQLEQRLDRVGHQLKRVAATELDRARACVATAAERLAGLSPLNVLARGYSLTRLSTTERVVKSAGDLAVGQTIRTRLADGEVESVVTRLTPPRPE